MSSARFRRVPFVPQMEVAECGAACLAMVAEYFGRHVPLSVARSLCGVSRDGVTALGIARAGHALGLKVQVVKADLHALRTLGRPLILHWEFNHFVVLERLRGKRAVLVDPAYGRRVASLDELDEKFTGAALAFSTTQRFQRKRREGVGFSRYFKVLSKSRSALAFILASAVSLELVAALAPTGTQLLIDHVIRPARDAWLWPIVFAVGAATLTQLVLTWLRDRAVQSLNFAIDLSLMVGFFDHMLSLPVAFLEQRTTGDLMQRVRANETLRGLAIQLGIASLDGLLVFGFGALMLAYDAQLGGIVLALSLSRVVLARLLQRDAAQRSATELSLRGREGTAMVEALVAPEFVKAFHAESLSAGRYVNRLVQRLGASAALQRVCERVALCSSLLNSASGALVLWLGGTATVEGRLSIGAFTGFLTLEAMLHAPLESVVRSLSDLIYARGILTRVDDVLETPPAKAGTLAPPDLGSAAIALERVTFRYGPAGQAVLDDVSLSILPGEKLAIVGPSGTGKSTLARLILGLATPEAGRVRVGGIDVSQLDRARYLRQVGVVLQEPFFFDDTARNNLALFDPEIPSAALERAAALACLEDVLTALPYGYDTPLGTNAGRLSGGQRQRLALARALVREPKLLLLDEATSSLDADLERRVHENLSKLSCTRVVMAHRLATVRDADRVLVLHGGKIVQTGTYAELRAQPGLFQTLARGFQ